jgi:8-oxo-dGTP diphosphatase
MSNYYSSNPKLYVGIDCIIFGFNEGELNLLLLKRNFEPAMGEWSLMGGFVQEDESVDDAAKRVLNELTGLEDVYMEQEHPSAEKQPVHIIEQILEGTA